MKPNSRFQRAIATFFLLIFFPTLVPQNLYASNSGSKSPEAASFEPVDATDMVNLITGQYSYVLPLLNVPSPEGGYPIALGYHAGIAMDQDASWAGLGWNVAPGSIQRGLNGCPDDYYDEPVNEYFYDSSRSEYVSSISTGYSIGAYSVGLGFNWGSNQSLGGVVSLGAGYGDASGVQIGASMSIGFGSSSNSSSVGIGVKTAGGLTVGVKVNSEGAGINAGFTDTNGAGFSVGYNTSGDISAGIHSGSNSVGISLSSNGYMSASANTLLGSKSSNNFKNTLKMGDFNLESKGWMVPITVPTPVGIFSLAFGKQEVKYYLSKNKDRSLSGALHYNKGFNTYAVYTRYNVNDNYSGIYPKWFETLNDALAYKDQQQAKYPNYNFTIGDFTNSTYSFPQIISRDAHEFSIDDQLDVKSNNLVLPSYDDFMASGQGLSGVFKATYFEDGVLSGENVEGTNSDYNIYYDRPYDDYIAFHVKPRFSFENEISTYLNTTDVATATFHASSTYSETPSSDLGTSDYGLRQPRRTSKGIRYFSNGEIVKNSNLKYTGFLEANASGFIRKNAPTTGIGAFEVTSSDGKTYHYSLPVYNHETITRTYGLFNDHPNEWESYVEKRQLVPYATHWLLTGITGPDFVDNGDGVIGDGDLGYWTSFEYGLWSDAYAWNQSGEKETFQDVKNPTINTWVRGRKQIYYLDKIKTRTHTAVFVKEERQDSRSKRMEYKSVIHEDNRELSPADYQTRFVLPEQNLLKLKKILLFKNEDLSISKSSGTNTNSTVDIDYSKNFNFINPLGSQHGDLKNVNRTKKELATFNNFKNVFDVNDDWLSNLPKAIKEIDFSYDASLYKGEGCLTLKAVSFKGKAGAKILPPYIFEYENASGNVPFNDFNKLTDGWGYNSQKPHAWSLNKITTPSGGKISINYESNKYKAVLPPKLTFKYSNSERYTSSVPSYNPYFDDLTNKKVTITVGVNNAFPISLNQNVKINYKHVFVSNNEFKDLRYQGTGYISNVISQNEGKYEVTFNGAVSKTSHPVFSGHHTFEKEISVDFTMPESTVYNGGGSRVKSLSISDGSNSFVTEYKYGQNEDGIGYLSYIPFASDLFKEVPYSSELPSPRVMYEYITVGARGMNNAENGKVRYRFNVMKEKDPDKVKFGNIFEIKKNISNRTTMYGKQVSIGTLTLHDNLNSIGQLLEVVNLNTKGHILSKISNNYYPIDQIPDNNGVLRESYQTYRIIDFKDSSVPDKWFTTASTKIKYPSILSSSTEQSQGYTYTTQFLDYDDISGVSKEQIMFSSDGRMYKSKIIPAFRKYPGMRVSYSTMDDNYETLTLNENNMLSQIAAYYNYIYQNGDWKETSVGITTWSNLWEYQMDDGNAEPGPNFPSAPYTKYKLYKHLKQFIWRKHKTYVWNGPKDNKGMFLNYNSSTDDGFNWTANTYGPGSAYYASSGIHYINLETFNGVPGTGIQPPKWKQTSEVTKYSHYSLPLEMKDVNNNHAATKMGDNDSKITAVGNAKYNELFYSGMENSKSGSQWLDPGIKSNGALRSTALAHTGAYSASTTDATALSIYLKANQHKAGKYKLNVWVHKNNAQDARVNYGGVTYNFNGETKQAGDWILKTHYLDLTVVDTQVHLFSATSAAVVYDDVMLRPLASGVTGYVYNQWDELSHIVGNNGLATRFEYDAAGRLIKTYVEVFDDPANMLTGGFKLTKENKQKYKYL